MRRKYVSNSELSFDRFTVILSRCVGFFRSSPELSLLDGFLVQDSDTYAIVSVSVPTRSIACIKHMGLSVGSDTLKMKFTHKISLSSPDTVSCFVYPVVSFLGERYRLVRLAFLDCIDAFDSADFSTLPQVLHETGDVQLF